MRRLTTLLAAGACLAGGAAAAALAASSASASSTASAASATATSDLAALPDGAWGVSAYDGYVVFSARAATGGDWQLMVWNDGAITTLPVPPRSVPFDADIGPDANGDPEVVYSQCATYPPYQESWNTYGDGDGLGDIDWARARGCRIWELSPLGGAPALVSGISSPAASDTVPAIWRGAIAFARVAAHASPRVPTIYLWRAGKPLRTLPSGAPPCPAGVSCPNGQAWPLSMSLDGQLLAIDWEFAGYHVMNAGCTPTGGAIWEVLADELRTGEQTLVETGDAGSCNGGGISLPGSPSAVGGSIRYYWRQASDGAYATTQLMSFTPASGKWRTAQLAPGPAVPVVQLWITAVAADGPTTYWVSYTPQVDTLNDGVVSSLMVDQPLGLCDPSPLTNPYLAGTCELEASSDAAFSASSHTYWLCPDVFYYLHFGTSRPPPPATCNNHPGIVVH
ncbi:MAG: hypothetical protein ABSG64_10120 [Solirubrobacteraceae bacterium]|jgi:hypothetical protein